MNSTYIPTKYSEKSKKHCQQFFRNVDCLLTKKGMTKADLVLKLKAEGFRINRHAISQYKRGKYWDAKLSYLEAYCSVLGESLTDMLTREYN